jgi:nucleolar protein 56
MKATLIVSSFGILAFDDDNKIISKAFFPRKPQTAATMLAILEGGKLTEEVTQFISSLREKGYDIFVFENAALAKESETQLGIHVDVNRPTVAGELLRSRAEQLAIETGFARDQEEFSLWTHNLTMETAKQRVKGAVEKRDLIVAQAIMTLDDLDKAINLLMTRAREWYGVHFPELDRLMEKQETFARLIVNLGTRDNFTTENLKREGIPEAKAEGLAKTAEKSMGAELTQPDLAQIQALCKDMLDLYDLRQNLETYMDKIMEEVAPNVKTLVGSLLGARLIAISGGISNLAKRPASTIQVLGAEKALFRSLKTGTRPPKHGMIFQHTLLHDAKRWQRGKIARALAGKLAIAARTDAYGHRNIGDSLKADLDKRIDEIREKYAEPPPISAERPRSQRPERPEGRRNRGKYRRER